jgi:serine/threonine-protein kinase RsbW
VVDFVVEELFTNMVKYGRGSSAPILLAVDGQDGQAVVTLIDRDVAPFDPNAAPDVDVGQPIEARAPGGLGLHLIRRMTDRVQYDYVPERREGRVTVWISRRQPAATGD